MAEKRFFVVFRPGRKGPRAFALDDNKPVFPDRRWGTRQPQAGEGWEVAVAGGNPGKTCYFVKPVRGPFPALSSKGNSRHLAALDAAIKDGTAVLAGESTIRGQSPERLYVLLDRGTYDGYLRDLAEGEAKMKELGLRIHPRVWRDEVPQDVQEKILSALPTLKEAGAEGFEPHLFGNLVSFVVAWGIGSIQEEERGMLPKRIAEERGWEATLNGFRITL